MSPTNPELVLATTSEAKVWLTSNVGAEFRNPARRSVGMLIRVIVVRPPERREVPAEVQFEVAPNTVTDTTDLGTAMRPGA